MKAWLSQPQQNKTTPTPISEQNNIAIQRIGLGHVYFTLKRHYRRNSTTVSVTVFAWNMEDSSLRPFFGRTLRKKNSWFISLILLFEMSANDRWAWTSSGKNVAEQFPGQEPNLLTNRVNTSSFGRRIGNINSTGKHSWSYLKVFWSFFGSFEKCNYSSIWTLCQWFAVSFSDLQLSNKRNI